MSQARSRQAVCRLLCGIALGLSVPASAAELFGPAPIRVAVGQSPTLLSSADLNGDETPDLIVPNFINASVSILLGDGAGSFERVADIGVGGSPVLAAVGEFNGDGRPDLAVTNSGLVSGPGDTVSILLGDGAGSFVRGADIAVGRVPYGIVAAELDGDGNLDLAVANVGDDDVSLLTGDGSGGFVHRGDIAVGDAPYHLAVGEFNRDGTADLAVTNSGSDSTTILLGDGVGGFSRVADIPVGRAPEFVVVTDLNLDGAADLAVSNTGNGIAADSSVSILLGDGAGGFTRLPDVGVGERAFSLAVGDFNGDAAVDLVVATAVDSLNVLYGDGQGSFARAAAIVAGVFPVSAVVGEFDGDGVPDLAVSNNGDDSVSVLAGDGFGGFVQGVNIGVGQHPVFAAVGNFNADGFPDLSVVNRTDDTLSILLGDGVGNFVQAATVDVGDTPRAVAVGRYDQGATDDLAVADFFGAAVDIRLGDGHGAFAPGPSIALAQGLESIATGEFDGDGVADLAVTNTYEHTLTILIGDGTGGFAPATTVDLGGRVPRHVAVGELNGDDFTDLIVTDTGTPGREGSTLGLLLGNGRGGFSPVGDVEVGPAPVYVAVGDFDGNDLADLAVANIGAYPAYSGSVTILVGEGAGTFRRTMDIAVGVAPASIAVGDLNGDDIDDLAVSNAGIAPSTRVSTSVSILIGDGAGGFVNTATAGVQRTPQSVVLGDFNGDRTADLAVVNADSNSVSLLFNQMSERVDVNGSNRVDGFDIAAVGRLAGVAVADPDYRRSADVDLNAMIDGDDLALVSSRFGELSKQASPLRPVPVNPLPPDLDTVTLQPVDSTGDLLTVEVLVNDRDSPASAADFAVTFEPTDGNPVQVLEVAGFDRGSYLAGGAGQFYEVDTGTPGRVGVRASRLPAEDRPGSGRRPLMTLFLRARREGEALLDFAPFQSPSATLLNAAGGPVGGVRFLGGVAVDVDTSTGGPTGQRIGFAPDLLDFEELPTGASSRRKLRIANFGFSELEVFGVQPSLPEITSFFDEGFTLPAFGYVELTVLFSMNRPGVFSGDLVIESNDPDRPDTDGDGHGEVRVPVLARSGPELGVSPLRLDFVHVELGDDRLLPVRISNLDSVPLTLTGFVSSDPRFLPQARFSTLAPGESGNVDVRFKPDGTGEFLGVLTLDFDAPAGRTAIVSLKGTGVAP